MKHAHKLGDETESQKSPLYKKPYGTVKLHVIPENHNQPAGKVSLVKRFSPFLILSCLLLILFPYMMVTGYGAVKSFWWLLFLFPFIESNLLFADFAIWKYFRGKKILPIWILELACAALIIHLLV